MKSEAEIINLIQTIVEKANKLKNKYTGEIKAPVNYACIFSQSQEEYDKLVETVKTRGRVLKEMPTGLLFQISPIKTVAGELKLLKICLPDSTRPEKGDADFTVDNFSNFKEEHLSKKGFKLMKRENFEMIELMDKEFDVRVYFSNPPLDEQLGIK